ncbi:MAG: hypothetical protein FWE32_09180 [Oscillospiraceae bacterium]|nr:hypothetical protein [Oscillospiraceae bacterium]
MRGFDVKKRANAAIWLGLAVGAINLYILLVFGYGPPLWLDVTRRSLAAVTLV